MSLPGRGGCEAGPGKTQKEIRPGGTVGKRGHFRAGCGPGGECRPPFLSVLPGRMVPLTPFTGTEVPARSSAAPPGQRQLNIPSILGRAVAGQDRSSGGFRSDSASPAGALARGKNPGPRSAGPLGRTERDGTKDELAGAVRYPPTSDPIGRPDPAYAPRVARSLSAPVPERKVVVVDNAKKGLLRRLLDAMLVILGGILFFGLCIIAPMLVVAVLVVGGPALVLVWARRSGSAARNKAKR